MKKNFLVLGAALLLANFSLEAASRESAYKRWESSVTQSEPLKWLMEHHGVEHGDFLGSVNRLQEAFLAEDAGDELVLSRLTVQSAVPLRVGVLKRKWEAFSPDVQSEVQGALGKAFLGDEGSTLHPKLVALLGGLGFKTQTPVAPGTGNVVEQGPVVIRLPASATVSPLLPAAATGVVEGSSLRRRVRASSEERGEGGVTPDGEDRVLHFEEHEIARRYPFPGRSPSVDGVNFFIDLWYDEVSLPDHEDVGELSRGWSTLMEWSGRKQDPGRFTRRKLYFFAGHLDDKFDKIGARMRQGSLVTFYANDLAKGRDLFFCFLAERMHSLRRVGAGEVRVVDLPSLEAMVSEFSASRKYSSRKGRREISHYLSQAEVKLHETTWNVIRRRNFRGIKRKHTIVADEKLARVRFLLFQDYEQKALNNILDYSLSLDAQSNKKNPRGGCSSCICGKRKPYKVHRRNLRFLVEEAKASRTERLAQLLTTYENEGVRAALQSLRWKKKNSWNFFSDVGKDSIQVKSRRAKIALQTR